MPHSLTTETYNILVPLFGDLDPHMMDDPRPSQVEQFAYSWNGDPSVIATIAQVSGVKTLSELELAVKDFGLFDEHFMSELLGIDPNTRPCNLFFGSYSVESLHDDHVGSAI